MSTATTSSCRIAVVGAGRLGTALVAALRETGSGLDDPRGRGARCEDADVVLLCVPDAEIAAAAAAVPARTGLLVGHCSGVTTLAPLAGHEGFSLHPLMTVPAREACARFAGATAAVAGATELAHDTARALALQLGMAPVTVADADRAAYHAAASMASNYLMALEDAAEALAASAGVGRERLVPLVRAAVDSWARQGAATALTGPVARGDEETIARQRAAVAERTPQHLDLFDALTAATRDLAAVPA